MRLQKKYVWKLTKNKKVLMKGGVGIYQSKKDVNIQFGRNINHGVDGNRKLFWEQVNKVNWERGELQ